MITNHKTKQFEFEGTEEDLQFMIAIKGSVARAHKGMDLVKKGVRVFTPFPKVSEIGDDEIVRVSSIMVPGGRSVESPIYLMKTWKVVEEQAPAELCITGMSLYVGRNTWVPVDMEEEP